MAQYKTPAGVITYALDVRFVRYLLNGENRVQVARASAAESALAEISGVVKKWNT